MSYAAAAELDDSDDAPPLHLLDSAMGWSRDGSLRRYVLAKRAWLQDETDWRHTIVANDADARWPDCIDCGGVALPGAVGHRLPLRRRTLAALIARQAPDVIEAGDASRLAWASLDAAQQLGVPAVAFCHRNPGALAARLTGIESRRGSWLRRGVGLYLRRLYREFDLVLAASDAAVRQLRELGVTRVQRQPLGVDSAVFHPGRRDAAAWRAALGVTADTRVLVHAGRFGAGKNLGLLAAAVRRLGPGYLLVAIGDGPAPPHGRHVRLLPWQAEPALLARALASADVFVDAGDEECSALGALEAMACGTPLVVRSPGALTEWADGGAGSSVRSDRPGEWAEAIAALFASGLPACATSARARAVEQDWNVLLPSLLRRYRQLIDGPAGAGAGARSGVGEVTQPAIAWHTPIGANLAPQRKDAV